LEYTNLNAYNLTDVRFHDATRAILCNKICNILTENKEAEHFA